MKSQFDKFRETLLREPASESDKCEFGKYPRAGKSARRQEDCTKDCVRATDCKHLKEKENEK